MSVAAACNLRVPNDLTVPPRRRQPAEFCPPSKLQAPTSGLPFLGGARKGSSCVAGSVGSTSSTLPFLLQLRAVVVIMPSRNRETVDILHSPPPPHLPPCHPPSPTPLQTALPLQLRAIIVLCLRLGFVFVLRWPCFGDYRLLLTLLVLRGSSPFWLRPVVRHRELRN